MLKRKMYHCALAPIAVEILFGPGAAGPKRLERIAGLSSKKSLAYTVNAPSGG